jgi:uncharacterized membrane protein YfcA
VTEQLLPFLIVCPLVFLAGFVDAIAGGGGLISLPAYLITGMPVHNAIATNKTSAAMGTAIATLRYARSGYIPWRETSAGIVFALAGSTLGAKLALMLDDGIFQIVMLVILPLTAVYVLRGKALQEIRDKEQYPLRKTVAIVMAAALGIGVYDGFYGPGTGTFLILILTGAAHMDLRKANGVTKAINLATNVAALSVYLFSGKVLLPLGLTAGLFSIAGNYIGARFFSSKGARSVKPVILVVLIIFFIRELWEILG